MILGAGIGWALHLTSVKDALPAVLATVVVGVIAAPRWLRQKIMWQKAGLPYLYRLADLEATILKPAVAALEELIAAAAPPGATPRQILIAGPLNSGRTELATGIGTEFAFKDKGVRYLSMSFLLELGSNRTVDGSTGSLFDDLGPQNVLYWPWMEAQVVIIDDVGPAIISPTGQADINRFQALLDGLLEFLAPALATRHTAWILGDIGSGDAGKSALNDYAQRIQRFCAGKQAPLAILLTPRGVSEVRGPETSAITEPVS
jgi:hypothetical protein